MIGNLATDRLKFVRDQSADTVMRLRHFNSLDVVAPSVHLTGDEEGNFLAASGYQDLVIHGGEGDDEMHSGRCLGDYTQNECDAPVQEFGEGGNDTLVGGTGGDLIIGGTGTDSATGGFGTDTCDAETETTCELSTTP